MVPPGALVMLTPLIVGALFGTQCLAGVLAGALVRTLFVDFFASVSVLKPSGLVITTAITAILNCLLVLFPLSCFSGSRACSRKPSASTATACQAGSSL